MARSYRTEKAMLPQIRSSPHLTIFRYATEFSFQELNQKANPKTLEGANSGFRVDRRASTAALDENKGPALKVTSEGEVKKAKRPPARSVPVVGEDEKTNSFGGSRSSSESSSNEEDDDDVEEILDDGDDADHEERQPRRSRRKVEESEDGSSSQSEDVSGSSNSGESDFESGDDSDVSEASRKQIWQKKGPIAPKGSKLFEVEKILAEASGKVRHKSLNQVISPVY